MPLERRASGGITNAIGKALVCGAALIAADPGLARAQTPGPEIFKQMAIMDAEKAQRTPAQRKLDSQLIFAMKRRRNDPLMAAMPQLRIGVESRSDGATLVDLDGTITPELSRAIRRLGGSMVSSHPTRGRLRAWVPLMALESLAARSDVRWIQPATTHATDVVSEGDNAHVTNVARSFFNVDGSGVKICALSDGVDQLDAVQENGELPAVDILPGKAGTGSEGTALLEIIHDLAPGAELGFATGLGGQGAFADAIEALRFQAGCDVIVDDIAYPDAPAFQDGEIAQAVTTVTNDGAVYVTSAGNNGGVSRDTPLRLSGEPTRPGSAGVFENDFRPVTINSPQGSVTFNDFGTGLANRVDEDSLVFVLQWSDPWSGASNDYDLIMTDASVANIVMMSNSSQTGSQPPLEIIDSRNRDDRTNLLLVARKTGANRFIRLHAFNQGRLASGTPGVIFGHKGSPAAITVAAAFVGEDPNMAFPEMAIEPFSSEGPRRIFFEPNGAPITPGNFSATGGRVIPKPDVVGADGVTTTTVGFEDFFGTSAAAPHVAAIAGLALSALPPDASPMVSQRLRRGMGEILRRTARPLLSPPFDMGGGTVNAVAAVQVARAGLPCADDLDNDADGLADALDPGCTGIAAATEAPACNDGMDNDSDGLVDAVDADCDSPSDGTECGSGGVQSMAIVPLLAYLGRRRRKRASSGAEAAGGGVKG